MLTITGGGKPKKKDMVLVTDANEIKQYEEGSILKLFNILNLEYHIKDIMIKVDQELEKHGLEYPRAISKELKNFIVTYIVGKNYLDYNKKIEQELMEILNVKEKYGMNFIKDLEKLGIMFLGLSEKKASLSRRNKRYGQIFLHKFFSEFRRSTIDTELTWCGNKLNELIANEKFNQEIKLQEYFLKNGKLRREFIIEANNNPVIKNIFKPNGKDFINKQNKSDVEKILRIRDIGNKADEDQLDFLQIIEKTLVNVSVSVNKEKNCAGMQKSNMFGVNNIKKQTNQKREIPQNIIQVDKRKKVIIKTREELRKLPLGSAYILDLEEAKQEELTQNYFSTKNLQEVDKGNSTIRQRNIKTSSLKNTDEVFKPAINETVKEIGQNKRPNEITFMEQQTKRLKLTKEENKQTLRLSSLMQTEINYPNIDRKDSVETYASSLLTSTQTPRTSVGNSIGSPRENFLESNFNKDLATISHLL